MASASAFRHVTQIDLLPNLSGLEAHVHLPDLVERFARLREGLRSAR